MDAKRNVMLMKNVKEQQRFSIRKLSIGATSVLLGSLFIFGGTSQSVKAAENSTSSAATTEEQKDLKNQDQRNNTRTSDEHSNMNSLDVNDTKKNLISENELRENKTERPGKLTNQKNDLHNMHFMGVVDSFRKTSPGSSAITDHDFKDGDTAEITYKLQGWIDGNQEHPTWQAAAWNAFYDTASDYLITIPQGFEAVKGDNGLYATGAVPDLGWQYGNFDETNLGNIGKNGEQIFLIHTDGTPAWQHPITFKFNLKATGLDQNSSTTINYSNSNPLLVAVNNGKDTFVGNTTITLKNDQTYTVGDVVNANTGQYQNITYQLVPGFVDHTPLSNDDFNFNALPDSNGQFVKRTDKTDNEPAEYTLSGLLTFKAGTKIHDGNYIDFKLGVKDANNIVHPYYQHLDDSAQELKDKDGNVYGQLTAVKENGEAFYRLVFNQNAQKLVPRTVTDQSGNVDLYLVWSDTADYSNLSMGTNYLTNPFPTPYIYEQTNDPNENNKFVYKKLNDDLQINDQILTSNAPVLVQEKYTAAPVMNGNSGTQVAPVTWAVRTWDEIEGKVSQNTNFQNNSQNIYIDTKETSDDFDIIVKVAKTPLADIFGKNPDAPIHYIIHDAGTLMNQITNGQGYGGVSFANKVKNNLSNQSHNNNGYYFGLNSNVVQRANVTPTTSNSINVLDTSDPEDPKYVSTLHFKLQSNNSDPAEIISYMAWPVFVTFSNYSMPENIHSYQDELKYAVSEGSFNHNGDNLQSKSLGAATANEELKKAMIETPPVEIIIKNNETGNIVKDYHQSFQMGVDHTAFFFNGLEATPAKNETSKDITEVINYVYDDSHKPSVTSMTTIPITKNSSGAWETDKSFDKVEIPLPDKGYYIESAINQNTNQNILTYDSNTGKYYVNSVAITSTTSPIVISVHYAKEITTKIHYIDVSHSNKLNNFQPTDGNELSHTIVESGKDGETFPTVLWNYVKDGWTLVSEDPELAGGKLHRLMKANLYIYLKKVTSQPTVPQGSTPQPTNASQPTKPAQPATPSAKPTQPVKPNKPKNHRTEPAPVHHNAPAPSKGTSGNNKWSENVGSYERNSISTRSQNQKQTVSTLPQTGEKETKLAILGFAVVSFALLFGLADRKKRKN